MKIGLVTPGGFDRTGVRRTIPVFNGIVERLAASNEIRVFTLYQEAAPSAFPLLGATVENIGPSRGFASSLRTAIRCATAILRYHRDSSFDLMHGLWAGESGLAAVLAARRTRIPCVVSVLGAEIANLPDIGYGAQRSAAGRALVRFVLRRADALHTNSRYAADRMGVRAGATDVIYQGADLRVFHPAPLREGPPWRLLHVGSLNRVKDQPTLLRAFKVLYHQIPQVRLDLVGEDTLNGAIQRLARDLGVADAVTFHGCQPPAVVADLMRGSHLLVHPSLHETGPVVFSEAAASGLPTLGTSVGILDDLGGSLCVTVKIRDHEALASEAIALLGDAERRKRLREDLIGWAADHDIGFTACAWERMYARIIGEWTGGPRRNDR